MLGFNGGLMGVRRTPTNSAASGLWFQNEQSVAERAGIWYGDSNFSSVSLLLQMDGSNGSTTFTDSSSNALTATIYGDAQISTAQSKFGGSSGVFDKTADRLTYANSGFAFGTGDFTIEAWIYSRDVSSVAARGWLQTSSTAGGLQTSYNDGLAILQGTNAAGAPADGGICIAISGNVVTGSSGSTVVLFTNQWQHIAVTRSGTTVRVFVDGVLVGTSTGVTANLTGQNLVVGGYYDTDFLFDGYIDDLRITKGISRYNATFTPPTASFPTAG
jgi:hypothetical protein